MNCNTNRGGDSSSSPPHLSTAGQALGWDRDGARVKRKEKKNEDGLERNHAAGGAIE
jgi:hypothetical protein